MATGDFGLWFQRLRIAHGFASASALAAHARMSASHVAMIERDAVVPRWPTVEKLVAALQLDVTERADLYRRIQATRTPPNIQAVILAAQAALESTNSPAIAEGST